MSKERRLGRGLEALLGRIPAASQPAADAETNSPNGGAPAIRPEHAYAMPLSAFQSPDTGILAGRSVQGADLGDTPAPMIEQPASDQPSGKLDISRIDSNPYQPRRDFDPAETESLAESLKAHGLLQPVVVRKAGDRYQLVVGERRLRAAQMAGWTEVPVQVVEADDQRMAELAIVENLHRRDLNALEKAASFQRYLEQYQCTQEELASRLKLDRSTIANLIRLLELPETVQDAVRRAKITPGHARALLPLGDEREQMAFCQRIQREELSVRQTEAMVQQSIRQADDEPLAVVGRDGQKTRPARPTSEHVAALEQQLRAALGAKVTIRQGRGGRGRVVIHFRNHEEFERLREHICGPAKSAAAG